MLKNRAVNIVFITVLVSLAIVDFFIALSPWIYVGLVLIYVAVQTYGSIILSAGFFIDVKSSGNREENKVAITFDDGPIPGKTDKILDLLKDRQVKAAFFCIGHKVKTNPDLMKRIVDEGHLVGNHSYWHGKTFDLQTPSRISRELVETNDEIRRGVDRFPNFFRPPYGVTNPMVASAIRKNGFITIGWSLRSFDTVISNVDKLQQRLLSRLRPGDIVLFHDYSDSTIQVLPSFIDHISKVGLKIVRVDELVNEKPYA